MRAKVCRVVWLSRMTVSGELEPLTRAGRHRLDRSARATRKSADGAANSRALKNSAVGATL